MRSLAPGVFLENKYMGVHLGAVSSDGSLLLVDSPIRSEDGREWLAQLADRGRPRYLVLLDHHPDRVLGARGMDVAIVGHEVTRQVMSAWPDTFKGATHPIGAEADRLKRITGVSKAVPELAFSQELILHMGNKRVELRYRPGPMAGSIWVLLPDRQVAFIGDAVTVAEPPYLGEADLPAWLEALRELAGPGMRGYTLAAARDGVVERKQVQAMAAWLAKVGERLGTLGARGEPPEAAAALAPNLLRSFKLPATRREPALLRLQGGLARLYSRVYARGG